MRHDADIQQSTRRDADTNIQLLSVSPLSSVPEVSTEDFLGTVITTALDTVNSSDTSCYASILPADYSSSDYSHPIISPEYELSSFTQNEYQERGDNVTSGGSQDTSGGNRGSRKRLRDADNWKVNIRKRNRNSGLEYVDRNGNVRSCKTMKAGCTNCSKKCHEMISHSDRECIFKEFWNLGNINRQREYLVRHVSCETSS